MPPSIASTDVRYFRLWRIARDMRQHTRLGGIFYLLAWSLCWGFGQVSPYYLPYAVALAAGFIVLMVLRLAHRLPEDENAASLRRWQHQHWALLVATALLWGCSAALTLIGGFGDARLIALLASVAFGTASVHNFPMRRAYSLSMVLLIYLPGLILLMPEAERYLPVLTTLACYLAYLLLVLQRNHREYHDAVEVQRQLLEQRQRYEQLSRTDSLTQLGNRLQFNNLFPVLVGQAKRSNQPLSLLLLDIDHFKQINDRYGHGCGDACLHGFAERMREVFRRDSDALLRLGGEEFGVLLPGVDLPQAQQLAGEFSRHLASSPIDAAGQLLQPTTSMGVGCFDASRDEHAEAFFKRVDDALYSAKHRGRNQLQLA